MSEKLTIGKVAQRSGVAAKTIRFYEGVGLIPAPGRSAAGYRLYGEHDVQRLMLVRHARLLGLGLEEIRSLLEKALGLDCAAFSEELLDTLKQQREEVDQRIADLTALRGELDALAAHVDHCCEGCAPGEMAGECGYCGLVSLEKGGGLDVDR